MVKVLVYDRDYDFGELTAGALKNQGFDAVSMRDGVGFLSERKIRRTLAEEKPDFVIIDLDSIHGVDVDAILRENKRQTATRIMITENEGFLDKVRNPRNYKRAYFYRHEGLKAVVDFMNNGSQARS